MTESPVSCTSELRVRYAETDQMGVVYHANYLVWCEVGRTDLLRSLGASYAQMEREGTRLAVADASLRFHGSARYDDRILVQTRLGDLRSRTITFQYLILRANASDQEQRLVTVRTSLVALDDAGRPRTLPTDLLALLRAAGAATTG